MGALHQTLVPTEDDSALGQGLENTAAERRQIAREVRLAIAQRQKIKNCQRDRLNERIARASPGTKAKTGDKVVKEAASTLHGDGLHPKLAHDHFTWPWEVVNAIRQGLSFTIRPNGRQLRQRSLTASDIKPFHFRPAELQHTFEDEYAHLV